MEVGSVNCPTAAASLYANKDSQVNKTQALEDSENKGVTALNAQDEEDDTAASAASTRVSLSTVNAASEEQETELPAALNRDNAEDEAKAAARDIPEKGLGVQANVSSFEAQGLLGA